MDTANHVRKLKTWMPGFLLLAALLPMGLWGQQLSDPSGNQKPADPQSQAQASTSNKPSDDQAAKKDIASRPPALGVAVDSARKSADLPTYVTTQNNAGEVWAGYETKQSAEFGGRISDFTGSTAMWDTLVNMGTGPRLLEYSLEMRSPTHTGMLFDAFNFSNFGYGGDPNNVSRLAMSKGKAYSFSANFRRDQNIFDYDLFANPLNPPTSNPNIPVLNSPHEFLLTRRISDVTVSVLPLSKVRFRLGWSSVVNEGTAFSTVHEGTEPQLIVPAQNTTNTYHLGVSFRFIPRTSFNYDQFYTYFKGDNTLNLLGTPFTLAGGIRVDLGLPFNTLANQPCGIPILATGFANPACNGFFSYFRSDRVRNSYPTEQASFQSSYFKRLDISGRFSYTGAESNLPSAIENFSGLITRTRGRVIAQTGFANSQRINVSGDLGITYSITDRLRLVDTFRFLNFRIPGAWTLNINTLYGVTLLSPANVFSPATCPPPFTAATCPQHIAASGPDVNQSLFTEFLRQDNWLNTTELEYDFTRRITGYIGFRYDRRDITHNITWNQLETLFPGPTAALANRGPCVGVPLNPDGTCTVLVPDSDSAFLEINGYSALWGFAARPTDNLRFSFDAELYYADATFTRISPRHLQWYKGRISYKPTDWSTLTAAVNIKENRNNTVDIGNLQHNRTYAFSGVFAPSEANWGLDLSYTYNDIFSQTNICFVATPVPPRSLSCGAPFLAGISTYNDTANVGSGSVFFKPVRRVNMAAGYTVSSSAGNTLILNPIAPTGPLSYNYHLPTALLAVEISKNLVYKAGWNYYGYNEKSAPGPTLPRDFRGNTFTLSLRYVM